MKADIDLSVQEIDLMIEGLTYRASRHESMARFNPANAGIHERTANAMRKLAIRLTKERDPHWDGRD